MLKKTLPIILIMVLFVVLAGCSSSTEQGDTTTDDTTTTEQDEGGATEPDEPSVVTFRSWSPVVGTTEQMIEAFEANNPDISIEPDITNYPEYLVDLQTRAAGDSLPDIIGLEPGALTLLNKLGGQIGKTNSSL
jgi:raffinose/stachyose/melibiose transport system substrate-binding protein